ncbi:ester cyclase [Pinirhizobacter sp.]|jgi:predicted ester cyclase|uniref:nuclear transport factor 2 family protein n=1 Tax=Pinirhizobacter sp. TaxID=2950432 RepID=UPI002F3E2542
MNNPFSRAIGILASLTLGLAASIASGKDNPSAEAVHVMASKFHRNFSNGEIDSNGPLAAPDIHVDSNNVILVGRDKFIERLKRYSVPFPGLQLKDRIVVVDGSRAAVQYVLQGEHKGPYAGIPATGNKIQAMSGEVFEFDKQGLMSKLITITKLDDVMGEIKGSKKIDAFENVTLLPNGNESPAYVAQVRRAASTFHKNFSTGQFDRNGPLVADNIHVNSNGTLLDGKSAFIERIKRYKIPFPNLAIRDEYVLVEGNRAAVEYVMEGTQTGPFTLPDGSVLQPTGKPVRVRGIEFMRFNQAGLLDDLITLSNGDDFVRQLTK